MKCEDGKLPTAWTIKPLGTMCEVVRGGSPRPIMNYLTTSPTGVNWLKIGDVVETDKYFTRAAERIKLEGTTKSRKVERGDLLLSNSMSFGRAFITLIDGYIHDGWLRLRSDERVLDKEYLYYFLLSPFAQNQFKSVATGSVVANLKSETVKALEVLLPPLPEQKRIAAILSSLDDKIELNNKINANLEQQAQSLFKAWFVDFEPFGGKMPEDWSVSSLADIAHYLNGLAMQKYRPQREDGSISVLKIKELRQGHCDAASDRCSAKIPPEYIIRDGDVIFSWSGSLLVDFWCGGKCGLNQHLFKVTSSHYDTWFFYSWTKYHLARFIAIATDKATTMGHIKRDALEDAKVLIPSEWDYQMLGNILAPMYRKIVCNRIENRKLACLRDILLQRLMSGKISLHTN